ncbi:chitin binding-like protein [Trypanosoma cruzi cruzi]|nr:chitin binding-like protein [Trypanosoma cruzi cruzi]
MWCGIEGAWEECRFTPGSCTCRRVPPAVDTATKDSPAVRGDVRWMVRGETTVKRLAAARVGVAPCAPTRGGSTRCGFYCWWQSLCVPGALFFLLIPCVCVRELLLGVTAAGWCHSQWMGGGAHCFTPFLLLFFSKPLTHKEGKEVRLNANRYCEIRRH